jgi:hypothetical protein
VQPLAIDLFCGLGGWTEGLLAEGYQVIGFDIEQHVYGEHRYPAQLVLQDVRTLHGRQFKDAALIVASPPCQAYSWRATAEQRMKDADLKEGGRWFTKYGPGNSNPIRRTGSKSKARKAASAAIAKIPLPLARHIARTWYPN